jgi:uncharacterized membrane-anchored protein YhcB (DUF1043 family)
MTSVPMKKEVNKTNPIIPVVAGMVGAVVGGVAVATSMIMGDKKNREKIKNGLDEAKDKTTEYVADVKKQALVKKAEVKEKVINEIKKI